MKIIASIIVAFLASILGVKGESSSSLNLSEDEQGERELQGVVCTGFTIHTPSGSFPLTQGMEFCPNTFPTWEVESLCYGSVAAPLNSVITKLYDNTLKQVVRRGNDKNGLNGFFWNAFGNGDSPTTKKFTNTADDLVVGREYCFYAYVNGQSAPTLKVCFTVRCQDVCRGENFCWAPSPTCENNGNCACATSTSGVKTCFNHGSCSAIGNCNVDSDCPIGSCIPNTCCGRPVCVYDCGFRRSLLEAEPHRDLEEGVDCVMTTRGCLPSDLQP